MILEIFEKKVTVKNVFIFLLLCIVTFGLLYLVIKLLNNLPTNKDLINALIGVCSAIISSILSALVAYLVANHQIKLEHEKENLRNVRYERVLLYELMENEKVLSRKESLVSDKNQYLMAISKLIGFDVWNSLKDKIIFSDDMIEPVFKAYKVLNTLVLESGQESIATEDFPRIVKKTQERVHKAVEAVSNQMES